MIGWGKGAWNLQASAYNFFHTSWEDSKESLSSDYYGFARTTFGTQFHARYSVSVTYTVGYGKINSFLLDVQNSDGNRLILNEEFVKDMCQNRHILFGV